MLKDLLFSMIFMSWPFFIPFLWLFLGKLPLFGNIEDTDIHILSSCSASILFSDSVTWFLCGKMVPSSLIPSVPFALPLSSVLWKLNVSWNAYITKLALWSIKKCINHTSITWAKPRNFSGFSSSNKAIVHLCSTIHSPPPLSQLLTFI